MARRDFNLPEEDIQYLDGLGLDWDAIEENEARAVILRRFILPAAFRPEIVDLMIRMPKEYTAGAALDMFFLNKNVVRNDGAPIPNMSQSSALGGEEWWQWSRHYPAKTPWRPGRDTLGTHLSYVQNLLDVEAKGKVWA